MSARHAPIQPEAAARWAKRALEWWTDDPLQEKEELEALLERADEIELAERLDRPLRFGTSGIRAPLGAGPARMNRVVAARLTVGLLRHLPPAATVIVGHDARHRSAELADAVAAVVDVSGGTAVRPDEPAPTPLVAYAVRELNADAGVMVTASHNPACDNGLKIYSSEGVQVAPPLDVAIGAWLHEPLSPVLRAAVGVAGVGTVMPPEVRDSYLSMVAELVEPRQLPLRVAYTPLHGVAGALAVDALAGVGFTDVHVVGSQLDPDPWFPTVASPNPEDHAALAEAIHLARGVRADLVLAHDPDGDRLAAAVPAGDGYRILSGNEIGTLLVAAQLERHRLAGRSGRPVVASTFVSTAMIRCIAEAAGARYVATPTGFKWVMQVVPVDDGEYFAFGFEEALGFAVTDAVRDKDGISASVVLADLVARLVDGGGDVLAELDQLALRHGVHRSRTKRLDLGFRDGIDLRRAVMRSVRSTPPDHLAGDAVIECVDHLTGEGQWPPTDLIALRLLSGARVFLRPSGTEPQLKCYIEVVEGVDRQAGDGSGEALRVATARAERRLADLEAATGDLLAGRAV